MYLTPFHNRFCLLAITLASIVPGGVAHAQRATENAITSADDAFGSQVGDERIGIYSDSNVRGFSPSKAGNLRIAGVYFDQVAYPNFMVGEIVRVGAASLDYPFPAPTGIVDYQVRIPGDRRIVTPSIAHTPYDGGSVKVEGQAPIVDERLGLWANANYWPVRNAQGSGIDNVNAGLILRFRHEGGEILGIGGYNRQWDQKLAPIVTVPGAFIPFIPSDKRYIGQDWAVGNSYSSNVGVIVRQRITDKLAFRGGVWDSQTTTLKSFTEVLSVAQPDGLGSHLVVADPAHSGRSISGEGQLAWNTGSERVRHRLLFMIRGRDRLNESGGSDHVSLGPVTLGELDPAPRPSFQFTPVNVGRIKQSTAAIGYVGQFDSLVQLNLGLQKTDYRASYSRSGITTQTKDSPWLYNASIVVSPRPWLHFFTSYVKGLEDSGVAPDNASNRGEQLPSSRTTQMDGGMRVSKGSFRLVASVFQIEKPYFSFDASNRFAAVGAVRHRGIEISASETFGDRLSLLAGAVFLDPVVSGQTTSQGLIGDRPVGTTPIQIRLDANYQTSFPGLSLNASAVYSGKRIASAQVFSQLGSRQLTVDPLTTVDIGARYRFKAAGVPSSARLLVSNVFNKQTWNVIAPSSYQPANGRGVTLEFVADF